MFKFFENCKLVYSRMTDREGKTIEQERPESMLNLKRVNADIVIKIQPWKKQARAMNARALVAYDFWEVTIQHN
jgi:hypothetical protein